jgi:hypothetical protein
MEKRKIARKHSAKVAWHKHEVGEIGKEKRT